ncbi:MAG: Fic family protein [Bacteroidales bacterium]|nr:Fic family protein [Bacteroidales bacterium]
MEIEKFNSGHYEGISGYKYFVPHLINDEWIWKSPEINILLEKAAVKLGELNSFSRLFPNIDIFIQLHVTKEAVVSSRIEGTRTKMDEALYPIEEVKEERRNDWWEVNNYVNALNEAIEALKQLPISSRLIKATHQQLLNNVRGEYKMPGEFRTSQNWIGGHSLADAVFIPPHHQLLSELMSDLEKFINNQDIKVPSLIKIALAHYQFETIHPFLDGNGRIGRLLITLFLFKEKILDKPLLYLSTYFEKNRMLYYDNLSVVRSKNDMIQWIKYFLVGIEQTAVQAVDTLSQILQLKDSLDKVIHIKFGRRSSSAILLMNELFKNPIITVDKAINTTRLSYKAANDLVTLFCKNGILKEVSNQNRNRIFVFESYLKIFGED